MTRSGPRQEVWEATGAHGGRRTVTAPGSVGQRPRPPARGRGPISPFGAVLGLGLIGSVGLWWMGAPVGSVTSLAQGLIEAGRLTGMVAGYLLLMQLLLMSRVGWVDRRLSANELLRWHRDIGGLLLISVLAHIALLVTGNASVERITPRARVVEVITTYPDMISAFAATGVLIGLGLLAVRSVRAIVPYELWYYLHLTSYLVLLLGYGHQFSLGRDLTESPVSRSAWIGLYVFVLACWLWGRVIAPVRLNLRHRLRIASVVAESPDSFSIYVHGRRLGELEVRAGQFFRWRFLNRQGWAQSHPFSLSASPNGKWLRLTVKSVGEHTEQLRWLEPGVRVLVEGPSGVFTANRRTRHRALLIAGGSGIAPIRALLEELPRGTVVIYRARTPDEIILRDELESLAHYREADIYYVLGSRTDPGPASVMTPAGLRQLVPDVTRRDIYLCGPDGLTSAAVDLLHRLHVPKRQIHLDPFDF